MARPRESLMKTPAILMLGPRSLESAQKCANLLGGQLHGLDTRFDANAPDDVSVRFKDSATHADAL